MIHIISQIYQVVNADKKRKQRKGICFFREKDYGDVGVNPSRISARGYTINSLTMVPSVQVIV